MFSARCVIASSVVKPRNPQVPLMVWIVRKMLESRFLSLGRCSSSTNSWSSRDRFSLLSIRNSLISSCDSSVRTLRCGLVPPYQIVHPG